MTSIFCDFMTGNNMPLHTQAVWYGNEGGQGMGQKDSSQYLKRERSCLYLGLGIYSCGKCPNTRQQVKQLHLLQTNEILTFIAKFIKEPLLSLVTVGK